MQQQVHLVMLLLLQVVMQQVTGPLQQLLTGTAQLLMGSSVLHPAVLQA
jgi:hypothetical protein